ncbi:hypothetical protein Taro_036016 [Colocasia esculenta]|uniref:Uncharacterized protein n=1 Tax=Colocasia esculenta TaxID=4460 RepID=A0A843W799_COLES|nr:hypothetical protein [Colocasia esculenta]
MAGKSSGKLQPNWRGPYVVTRVYEGGGYMLAAHTGDRPFPPLNGVGATPSRRLACGYPLLVSQDAECDSVLCVLLVVALSRSPWSPFSTARVKRRGKTGRGPDARESVCSVHTTMAPRRRPREGVAEQVTRQEAGDAPPPQQT